MKKTKPLVYGFMAIALNSAMPGTILAFKKRTKIATSIAIIFIAVIAALSLSRKIAAPEATLFLLLTWLILTSTTSIWYFYIKEEAIIGRVAFAFILTLSFLVAAALTKEKWLGIRIFLITSDSMMPTLQAGQYIVVDTLAYSTDPPREMDIIIFKERGLYMVKRITESKNGKSEEDSIYVTGDNRSKSRDSRHFGRIALSEVVGKASFIIYDTEQEKRRKTTSFTKIQ
jgi:signal peptidase I